MSLVSSVETFVVTIPRETPYLGPLGPNDHLNARGYIVRSGNGTIYPTVDRSILVKLTCDDGMVGWGETYGICAPRATCEIINDLLAPVLIGEEAGDVEALWDKLYGLMRVRGCTSGFHLDAIAAIDIALWDLRGKALGKPLHLMLDGSMRPVPGYVSGLPQATLAERVATAKKMRLDGHSAFKFAGVVSHEGIVEEMRALREALGPDVDLMVDLHWKFDADSALDLIEQLVPYRPKFVEAPVKPEDVSGLAEVARRSSIPVASGEEWYTAYEVRNRLAAGPLAYLQPEMGHTGITQFLRIAALAEQHGVTIAPHATIGSGIFLAASLHASATLPNLWKHEWQHSIFGRNAAMLEGSMSYADGHYVLPDGPGLGVAPGEPLMRFMELVI